jgi:hypothetical protein
MNELNDSYQQASQEYERIDPLFMETMIGRLKASVWKWREDPTMQGVVQDIVLAITALECAESNLNDETQMYLNPHRAAEDYETFRDQRNEE